MTPWFKNPIVLGIRTIVYYAVAFVVTLAFLLTYPLIYAPVWVAWGVLRAYTHTLLWLLRVIVGQTYEVEGLENLPDGVCILACRHEAVWETFFLPVIFDMPSVLLKQEILRYPIAGPLSRKFGFIGVDRSGSLAAAKRAFEEARVAAENGRRVLIFPSGTRNPAKRDQVQPGVAVLYRTLQQPCVPVVLNSGLFWRFDDWKLHPGTIKVRISAAIPAGLRASELMTQLKAELAHPI